MGHIAAKLWNKPVLISYAMADFFLGHLETSIFKDQMPCHANLYVRYTENEIVFCRFW